uniref:GIY-YIG domain-containing protein n=1 Tax=viral metagenome TaxID=1070528 RepID=A0A6C0EJT3_9ZZZZ
MDKNYIVYLLNNSLNSRTYLGITDHSNEKQVLKQHNGELKGGVKYTSMFKGDGVWTYCFKVENLTKRDALSIERTVKNKRKGGKETTPVQKRLNVLLPILVKYPECNIIYS